MKESQIFEGTLQFSNDKWFVIDNENGIYPLWIGDYNENLIEGQKLNFINFITPMGLNLPQSFVGINNFVTIVN